MTPEESIAPAPALHIAAPTDGLKLDFGCGNNPREGFEGVDLFGDKAKHRVDLFKFPLPWTDGSVEEIHASHFIEHLPAREIEHRDMAAKLDNYAAADVSDFDQRFFGKDFLLSFFDECHRVLQPGGWMTVIVPCLRSNRAFMDPTHRRFICEETFAYLSADWRKVNVPQYPVTCNFEAFISSAGMDLSLRTPEVAGIMQRERWNVVWDLQARLKAIK
jgi:predicted SAM-dependent methyltransferase